MESEFIAEWNSSEPFVVAHTSGSTGNPKDIKLLKSDMRISARATNSYFGINKQSTLATPLSMNYIAGKMMAVRALEADCKLLCMPVSNTIDIRAKIDLLAIVPSQVESLLADAEAAFKVRNLLLGGAPLSEDIRRRIVRAGFNAFIGYGMTETCSHIALRRLDDEKNIYKAMPGIRFAIDNRGCLTIISDKFSWRRLQTNDIAELETDTSFKWLGRADFVINSGGIKIHPEQLEQEIRRRIPLAPSFYAIGEPDEKWGEAVVIVAECDAKTGRAFYKNLSEIPFSKGHKPKAVLCVAELPTTVAGRKLKRELPEEFIRIC